MFLLACVLVTAQSRTPSQSNSNKSGKQHVATLRSSDSPEGSRVAISSDQSLNDYEAYRRGDRFYVKIPAAEVPRAEALRGRGFADVKAQRSGDSTVVSFRLQPGATAHVEQRANRLDVVVAVPGAIASNVAANRTREPTRTDSASQSLRNSNANQRSAPAAATNKNTAGRSSSASALSNSNSNANSKAGPTVSSNASAPKATPTPLPSPKPSPTAKLATPTPAQKSSPTTATSSSATSATPSTQSHDDAWTRMKERAHYWILLAQLNPIPVATGAVILLLLIGLFLFQRRRAKATRRVKPARTKRKDAETASDAVASASAASAVSSATIAPEEISGAVATSPIAVAPLSTVGDDARRERVARVAEEAKKVFAGGDYNKAIIGSDDRETRQLVGAELLAALVGRNIPRRERAREAFMTHGYFDDATRDLRVADSPNERAAAARRLSFVHDRESTPHLIGALGDPAPDVRRAAVEALMDLRDPAAIGPLNSLMKTENDRKVPRTLIKHAIEACATSAPDEVAPAASDFAAPILQPSSPPVETEREVIEL